MSQRSRPEPRDGVAPAGAGSADLLAALRTATAGAHARVESLLNLTSPDLTVERLGDVVARLGSFWVAAEAGLGGWAGEFADDAERLDWGARRRAPLFAADVAVLGAEIAPATNLAPVTCTAEALGRLYVLEGSTLGGQMLTRAFASRPASDPVSSVRLRCFSPYGDQTGARWRDYRHEARRWVDAGGNRAEVEAAAVRTFDALETWCAPLRDRRRVGAS